MTALLTYYLVPLQPPAVAYTLTDILVTSFMASVWDLSPQIFPLPDGYPSDISDLV